MITLRLSLSLPALIDPRTSLKSDPSKKWLLPDVLRDSTVLRGKTTVLFKFRLIIDVFLGSGNYNGENAPRANRFHEMGATRLSGVNYNSYWNKIIFAFKKYSIISNCISEEQENRQKDFPLGWSLYQHQLLHPSHRVKTWGWSL